MKAVCYKCGDFKPTAWKRCKSCNYRPVGDDEKAQHLLLSSHFNSEKKLLKFSEHIKDGKPLEFKKKDLEVVRLVLKDTIKRGQQHKIYIFKLAGTFLLTILFMVIFYFIQTAK